MAMFVLSCHNGYIGKLKYTFYFVGEDFFNIRYIRPIQVWLQIYDLYGKLVSYFYCSVPQKISLVVKSIQEAETVESWNRLPGQGQGTDWQTENEKLSNILNPGNFRISFQVEYFGTHQFCDTMSTLHKPLVGLFDLVATTHKI